MTLRADEVLSFFERESGGPLRVKDLMHGLAIPPTARREVRRLLRQLASEGALARLGRGRYELVARGAPSHGFLVGYGEDVRFETPDGEVSWPVPSDWTQGAHHGDRVEIRSVRGPRGPLARVVRVLERSSQLVLAVYRETGTGGFAIPQDPRLPPRITLEESPTHAHAGDLLLVEIFGGAPGDGLPQGRVRRVLGGKEEQHRFYRLLQEFSLPLAFPREVLEEAAAIEKAPPAAAPEHRLDLRSQTVFTIDPADAYDHDDAVSIEVLGGGGARVGVHIADVSHYVPSGCALDREACARGCSVYLDEGVVPMFPEEITRGILSLVPREERLALSVLVELDEGGTPRAFRLAPSLIRSGYRLSYEEAEGFLEEGTAGRESQERPSRNASLGSALRTMWSVADCLRQRRVARGALDLESLETEVVWGPLSEPVELIRRKRLRTHRLIEEFMLLANETVARYLARRGQPLILRVHEPPSEERLEELGTLLRPMGYRLPAGDAARALAVVLRQAEGTPEAELVSMLVLRSMKKAIYAERNVGHFGLASANYTHFTSPIRRYPDLTVHRSLREAWETIGPGAAGELEPWERVSGLVKRDHRGRDPLREDVSLGRARRDRVSARALGEVAEHATRREILAEQVERASSAQVAARYMRSRLGDEFAGIIVGFAQPGMFVRLREIPVEGLVPVHSLGRERFTQDEGVGLLRGDRTGRTYRLGEEVRVRVARADPEARQIDFEMLSHEARRARGPARGARGTGTGRSARREALQRGTTRTTVRGRRAARQSRSAARERTPPRKAGRPRPRGGRRGRR